MAQDQLDPTITSSPGTASTPPGRPNRQRMYVVLGVVLVILLVIGLVATKSNKSKNTSNQANSSTQGTEKVEIQITKDGFKPATLQITKGSNVTWINKDTNPHVVASNPHPEHTGTPGLDSKTPLGPGATYSFTFDKAGTVTYHDHLHPEVNGTIVVQ